MINHLVPRDPVQPSREGYSAKSEVPDILPGLQKNLVSEVLCLLTVADLYENEPLDLRLVFVVEEAEGRGLTHYGASN